MWNCQYRYTDYYCTTPRCIFVQDDFRILLTKHPRNEILNRFNIQKTFLWITTFTALAPKLLLQLSPTNYNAICNFAMPLKRANPITETIHLTENGLAPWTWTRPQKFTVNDTNTITFILNSVDNPWKIPNKKMKLTEKLKELKSLKILLRESWILWMHKRTDFTDYKNWCNWMGRRPLLAYRKDGIILKRP